MPEPTPSPVPDWLCWLPPRLVALDVEATGLSAGDRMVSVGAVALATASLAAGRPEIVCHHLVVDPGRTSHPAALAVHGYDDWLLRHQDTAAQQALDAKARKRNLLHAFSLAPQVEVRGLHLALVDDVLTTGATAQSLARLLRQAGARQVDVYCLARTPRPDAPP